MLVRSLSLLLAFCIVLTLFTALPIGVSAATSGICGDNVTWNLDDQGVLTIDGTGAMLSSSFAPWYSLRSSITSVTIGNDVTSIGEYAFYGCKSLASVTIGDSVKHIGERAFVGCSSLTNIIVNEHNTSYCSIAGNLFDKNKTTLIQYAAGKSSTYYTVPYSVTSIGKYAFYKCTNLKKVTIPDGATSIGDFAFYECTNLTSITIPDSVTSIGECAFYECISLPSITIPEGVTSIDDCTFFRCESLVSVIVPEGITTIGLGAFYECTNLLSITIPEGVTSIGDCAFYKCESLTGVIIPNSVTSIGGCAFSYCTSLARGIIPSSVTSVGEYAFDHCTSLTDVYYTGSQNDWKEILLDSYNSDLTNATRHYSYETTDYEILISDYSYGDNQLTINSFARNNTGDILVAEALFALYGASGKLKGVRTQPVRVGGYFDTDIDVCFENYTYANGDYVKMFMWSGLTNIRSLVNIDQINIEIE